jgi:hypothetical protein
MLPLDKQGVVSPDLKVSTMHFFTLVRNPLLSSRSTALPIYAWLMLASFRFTSLLILMVCDPHWPVDETLNGKQLPPMSLRKRVSLLQDRAGLVADKVLNSGGSDQWS